MEATTKETKRKKSSSYPKKKASKKDIVPQNKYMEAFLKHQGSFVVYDPNFML